MARLLLSALAAAGCTVEVASRLRMFDRHGDAELTRRLAEQARAEARVLAAAIRERPAQQRPDLVFTYHVHYKAPDVVGPELSRSLGLPYVIVEGSRAPRRAHGLWAAGHALAEAALDAADLVLVVNERDRPALLAARPPGQKIADLPPFVDSGEWPAAPARGPLRAGDPVSLLAVGMMREGDKLASYRLLAEALARAPDLPWRLTLVGDGPARAEVSALFAPFGERVAQEGRLDRAGLARAYAGADLLVWPAVNEAFGMAFLEAALADCPALAEMYGGVPGVVRDGVTGLLVPGGDAEAFAAALQRLVSAPGLLRQLGQGAGRFVREERNLGSAAAILRRELGALAVSWRRPDV